MKATIIIPNINGKGWLKDSIESVYAQTEQDFELIVVDNGSTDESLEQAFAVDVGDDDGRFHRFCAPAHFLLAYKRQYNIF